MACKREKEHVLKVAVLQGMLPQAHWGDGLQVVATHSAKTALPRVLHCLACWETPEYLVRATNMLIQAVPRRMVTDT